MASEVKTRSTVAAKSGGTGAVVHVTSEDDYKTKRATAGSNVLVVVDFSAEWCGPCKTIAPAFSKLAEEHPDVLFLKVDVDALERVAMDAGISAMPTFKYYKGSRLVGEIKGADIKKVIAELDKAKKAQPSLCA